MWLLPTVTVLLASVQVTQGGFIVAAPKIIRPGMPMKVSVTIQDATSSVNVNVKLVEKGTQDITVTQATAMIPTDSTEILTLQVPATVALTKRYALQTEGSGGLRFKQESNDFQIKAKTTSIFIQTDKAIYKPGQTVKFRAFAVTPKLLPVKNSMDIGIYDAKNNKIKQWLNEPVPNSGVVTKELPLSDQPILGDWSITVTIKNEKVSKDFKIEEYVLPKFEVSVVLPPFVAEDQSNAVTGTVKAKYTYGKTVTGRAEVSCEVNSRTKIQVKNIRVSPGDGGVFSCDLASLYQYDGQIVKVSALVTEDLTGKVLNGSGEVKIYKQSIKIAFMPSTPTSFKPGLKYIAFVQVSQPDGTPVTSPLDGPVQVATTISPTDYRVQKPETLMSDYTVPQSGIFKVEMDVPSDTQSLSIVAKFKKNSRHKDVRFASKHVSKFESRGDHGIQVSLKTAGDVKAGDTVTFQVKTTQPGRSYVYQILSKGVIVTSGQVSGRDVAALSQFSVVASAEMAPNARVLVYQATSDGELIVDSLEFNVEGMFRNQVTLALTPETVEPGDKVTVKVTAAAMSYVGLLAVDQSVLLLKTGNDITADDVTKELASYDPTESPDDDGGCCIMPFRFFFPYFSGGQDSSQILKKAGFVVVTDLFIFKKREIYPMEMDDGMVALAGRPGPPVVNKQPNSQGQLQEVTKTRSQFPETWLWAAVTASADGKHEQMVDVPDTITSWVASAFAMSDTAGFGVGQNTAKVTVFQPFFVSLNLPYSIKRGEQFQLQVIVFNYLDTEQEAYVTLKQSSEFKVKVSSDEEVSKEVVKKISVKKDSGGSVSFWIIPQKLGHIMLEVKAQTTQAADGVKRTILVKPEGKVVRYNQARLVEMSADKASESFTFPLTFPSTGLVDGSQIVKVSVTGDMMGPSIEGLDNLLKMPYGCGEQNMLNFAPAIYITNYLTTTKQLTGPVKDKATKIMEKGYQKELTYKHDDGSFSAFGNRDDSGSMWLTAFVVRCFRQAKPHIGVDEKILSTSLLWMTTKQRGGRFTEPGRVLHKELQGGSASGISMTAYVLISFLETRDLELPVGDKLKVDTAINQATQYLESKLDDLSENYALAIVTYALTKAQSGRAADALTKLESLATMKDGMKHWSEKKEESTTPAPGNDERVGRMMWIPRKPRTTDVEATAYALLSYVAKSDVTGGLPVMRWLMSQRNEFGGFTSTQDTVIGLQALSEFAAIVFSSDYNADISVKAGTFTQSFTKITATNALVFQSMVLPNPPPQDVVVTVTGSGKALVQVSVQYNIDTKQESDIDIVVTSKDKTDSDDDVEVEMCISYKKDGASGMVVMEMQTLSGFNSDPNSIEKDKVENAILQRVESSQDGLTFYFDEITKKQACIPVKTTRQNAVSNMKPAVVTSYKYYEPETEAVAYYTSEGAQEVDMCKVCPECSISCPQPTVAPTVTSGHCSQYSVVGMLLALLMSICATLFCFI